MFSFIYFPLIFVLQFFITKQILMNFGIFILISTEIINRKILKKVECVCKRKRKKSKLWSTQQNTVPLFLKKCVWTDILSKIKFKQDTKFPLFLSFSNPNNTKFV